MNKLTTSFNIWNASAIKAMELTIYPIINSASNKATLKVS